MVRTLGCKTNCRTGSTMAPVNLPYLQIYKSKKVVYAYYRRGSRRLAIRDKDGRKLAPGDPEFLAAYTRLHASFEAEKAAAKKDAGILPGSLADLIIQYKSAPEFKQLSKSSQYSYGLELDFLRDWKGHLPVAGIHREFVLKLRDRFSDRPRKADYAVAVLRLLLNFAIERPRRFGLQNNPALGVKKLNKSKPFKAWPQKLVNKVLNEAPEDVAQAVVLGLNTGQRIGDCVKMTWSQFDGEGVWVAQEKANDEDAEEELIWIAASQELLELLNSLPRTAVTILTTAQGRPWRKKGLQDKLKAAIEAPKSSGQDDAPEFTGYSFHGLRKLAGKNLAEAGCSAKQIAAILGHKTLAMTEHYVREAGQKGLSKGAITKLDEHRAANKNRT